MCVVVCSFSHATQQETYVFLSITKLASRRCALCFMLITFRTRAPFNRNPRFDWVTASIRAWSFCMRMEQNEHDIGLISFSNLYLILR